MGFCLRATMKHAIALLTAVLTAVLLSTPALSAEGKPAAKPDLAKGQASAATCLACHTADGSRGAPANPILGGQHPEYLAKQLHEFKSGKRKNAIMQGMAAVLSDDDIRNISAFYAGKPAKPGAAKNKATVELGETIWRGGIADRKIPACAGCHGPTGAGIPAQYPRIAGQHADYTEAQLLAFRSGARANNIQMTGVAAKMNDAEIKAVSDYAAGLR
jgi:cytochrome c553